MSTNTSVIRGVLGCTVVGILTASWLTNTQAETQGVAEVLKRTDKNSHLEALLPCRLVGYLDAICVVTEKNDTSRVDVPTRTLVVYNEKDDRLQKVFQYDSYNGLLTLRWVDISTILAVWDTGSGMNVTLFRVVGQEIKLALEVGCQFLPEVVDVDGDGSEEVIISHDEEKEFTPQGQMFVRPTKASIYTYGREGYKKVRVVAWKDRLKTSR